MYWLTVILGAISVGCYLFYKKRQRGFDVFTRIGIPGPQPHWLFGNFKDMKGKFPYQAISGWTKTYGKVYGYYEGPRPVLVSTDLDFLQEVFIKQFSKFHSRKGFGSKKKSDETDVFMANGETWKRLRTIINPTFSMAKLKMMAPGMNNRSTTLLENLKKECDSGKPFDIYKYYQGLTLEVIGHLAVGIETNAQTNPEDKFLLNCRNVFDFIAYLRPVYILSAVLPEFGEIFRKVFQVIYYFLGDPKLALTSQVGEVIKKRRKEKFEKRVDLMQLLLDAEDPNFSPLETDDKPGDTRKESKLKKLTNEEAKSQGYLFMLAGYETTSTALAYVTYLLAKHPDIQVKLQQEIDQTIEDDENISYEDVQKLPYLEMVLFESLRIYPIAAGVTNRKCVEPCTVCGYDITPGITVQPDVWSIHYDPQIWPEPHKFDPERFSAENKAARHPLAWLPFGAGPRNCVGLRFALMETKLALCRIMKKFTILKCDETPDELVLREAATVTPKEGVIVKLTYR